MGPKKMNHRILDYVLRGSIQYYEEWIIYIYFHGGCSTCNYVDLLEGISQVCIVTTNSESIIRNQIVNWTDDRLGKIVIFILWNFGQETLVFWPVEIGACCKCHPILGWDYHLMPSTSVPASRSGIPLPGWSATGLFIHGPSVPMAKWLTFPSRKLLSWALNPSKPCLLVGRSKNSSGEGICYIIINLYIYVYI